MKKKKFSCSAQVLPYYIIIHLRGFCWSCDCVCGIYWENPFIRFFFSLPFYSTSSSWSSSAATSFAPLCATLVLVDPIYSREFIRTQTAYSCSHTARIIIMAQWESTGRRLYANRTELFSYNTQTARAWFCPIFTASPINFFPLQSNYIHSFTQNFVPQKVVGYF